MDMATWERLNRSSLGRQADKEDLLTLHSRAAVMYMVHASRVAGYCLRTLECPDHDAGWVGMATNAA